VADDLIQYRLGSVEYVRAKLTSKTRTGAQIAAGTVKMALMPAGTDPASGDFALAAWELNPGTNYAIARILWTFNVAGKFDVFLQYTDSPETPIKLAGRVQVR